VGRGSVTLVQRVMQVEALRSIEALLPRLTQPVMLFGPKRFRSEVPASSALDFLHAGFNLYIHQVETVVPEAAKIFHAVAEDLGVAPWQISVEAFAGMAGGVSSRHYDHDINFQILLSGEKLWRLEENHTVQNPLQPFHPRYRPDGTVTGFYEEALALNPNVPLEFDPVHVQELKVQQGSVMFLPRGHWHEVHSLTPTWSINIVIKGVTWGMAVGHALTSRLHALPQFRDYCGQLQYGVHEPTEAQSMAAQERFESMRRAAIEALSQMTYEEASLSGTNPLYRWSTKARGRHIVSENEGTYLVAEEALEEPIELDADLTGLMKTLASFQYTFSWEDVRRVGQDIAVVGLWNLLDELVELGLLERVKR
jgi:hypothetical protein